MLGAVGPAYGVCEDTAESAGRWESSCRTRILMNNTTFINSLVISLFRIAIDI